MTHTCVIWFDAETLKTRMFQIGFMFSVIDRLFLMTDKNLRQFGRYVWKGRLVNTVTVSFSTIIQLTEIS